MWLSRALLTPWLLSAALIAWLRARQMGTVGLSWASFGRKVGWVMIRRGDARGLSLLLTPVNIVRYWEFPFAFESLPSVPDRCLDVSSPRLFSIRLATTRPQTDITMINPDGRDTALTRRLVDCLHISNIRIESRSVAEIDSQASYDCVWALSVVEHFAGERGDSDGIAAMFRALAPGGRLIVTVPVDRAFRLEFRDHDEYELAGPTSGQSYFFQRYYDETAIHKRLVEATGQRATTIRWFGERTPGRFLEYERRWQRLGHRCTVWDPVEIGREYLEYASWRSMPGIGVCGFVIEKPLESHGA